MKLVSAFFLLVMMSSFASAAHITQEELKNLVGEYNGVLGFDGEPCVVDIAIKNNKIGVKISGDSLQESVHDNARSIPSLSSNKIDLTRFVNESGDYYDSGYAVMSERPAFGIGYDNLRFDVDGDSLRMVELWSRRDTLFTVTYEASAQCISLVKVK